jgi:hypothetical protein
MHLQAVHMSVFVIAPAPVVQSTMVGEIALKKANRNSSFY